MGTVSTGLKQKEPREIDRRQQVQKRRGTIARDRSQEGGEDITLRTFTNLAQAPQREG
jgi:hypothetical protein